MNRPHLSFLPVACALSGLALFAMMDGLMKAASIAVGAYSAVFWRNMLGAGITAPLWLWRRKQWPNGPALRLHALRSAVAAAMTLLFFFGLVRTPLAEAVALSFIAPLVALYLAAAVLGERVSRRAIIGSFAALGGVVVIVLGGLGGAAASHRHPEALTGLAAILASALLYGWNLILQRQQAQLAEPEEIAFFQTFGVFVLLAAGAPWLVSMPLPASWAIIATAAVLAAISLMLMSWAYARAEAQALVPLEYTAFIWAALTGWAVFREPVTMATLAGVALIVVGCLFAAPRQDRIEVPA